jgi:ABC-type branched-subunit amino acid transport system substrate-binding protein
MLACLLSAILVAASPAAPPSSGGAPQETPRTPYLDRRAEPLAVPGPGREDLAPKGVAEIRIGWFGPSDEADAAGGDFWLGALLAQEEINTEGGVSGIPVRLVPGWAESPWAGGVSRVVRMVYEDEVWAILGSIDGSATHLAEQVAAKALVPLVSPGSTDKSVSFAGVPWMFTLLPGDDFQAAALADWLSARPEARRIALISATDHDSRAAAAEWRSSFGREGLFFATEAQCDPGATDAQAIAKRILRESPRTAVLLASPSDSGRLAAALRASGYEGAILGGSNLARRAFSEAAGSAAAGAIFPLLSDPASGRWARFARSFAGRSAGAEPDFAAAAGYDSLRFVVEAVRRAGLNRARIREALRELSPWQGVGGEIRFDNLGRNVRPVGLGTYRGAKVVALGWDKAGGTGRDPTGPAGH